MSIKIDGKIFLFALLFMLTKQWNMYVLLLIFAAVHEMGHFIMRTLYGVKTRKH